MGASVAQSAKLWVTILNRMVLISISKAELANSVDPDEMAQHEQPNLDLHCLPSSL